MLQPNDHRDGEGDQRKQQKLNLPGVRRVADRDVERKEHRRGTRPKPPGAFTATRPFRQDHRDQQDEHDVEIRQKPKRKPELPHRRHDAEKREGRCGRP